MLTLNFFLPGDYNLTLDAFVHGLSLSRFDFESSEVQEPVLLGTMDAHQMGDVFRWEEFQALIERLVERYTPRWALELLLQHYVAITVDCAEQHRILLQGCLQESQVFTATKIDCIVGYSQRVGLRRDFRWQHDPKWGWVAEGGDAYSMRQRPVANDENDAGPHFDFVMFADFMNTLRY